MEVSSSRVRACVSVSKSVWVAYPDMSLESIRPTISVVDTIFWEKSRGQRRVWTQTVGVS